MARIHAISDTTDADPAYREGLRAAVSVALDYALEAVEAGEANAPLVPPVLLVQARMAARSGIALETVLRRYLAGYTLLIDFLVGEFEGGALEGATPLRGMLRGQAAALERLLAAVSEEYTREGTKRRASTEERSAERVERLLAGEPLDTTSLNYDFEGHHTGVIATGPEAAEAILEAVRDLDCRVLLVRRDEASTWAWLGARRELHPEDVARQLRSLGRPQVAVGIGEPARGLAGWRLSHRQAAAALPVALRSDEGVVCYADVALLTSILRDDLLATSLRERYLTPLEAERDGGEAARETLRAYFAAERNVSSTAARLGVSRRTVTNRLCAIEERLGLSVSSAPAELEAALRLEGVERVAPPRHAT